MSTVLDRTEELAPAVPAPAPPGGQPPAPAPAPEARLPARGEPTEPVLVLRPALGALLTTLGAAFLLGGMFLGVSPRVFAGVGALVGVAAAAVAARATRRATLVQVLSLLVVGAAGLFALLTVDLGAPSRASKLIAEAIKAGRFRRPPVPFDPGWKALVVWASAMLGYAASWVGTALARPALGVLVPVPVMAFTAIAQPPETEVVGGVLALATFIAALAVINRADRGERRLPTAYEVKRALRTAPILAAAVAGLVALNQANLLFPQPLYDPAQKAQLPKAVPLTKVKDRVLFKVRSSFPGPWRTGVLDVYDGQAWRLPPYSASSFKTPPSSGIINPRIQPNQKAEITIEGLDGTVLPVPPRTQAIVTERGRNLVYDPRTETFRTKFGQVRRGMTYAVAMALPPLPQDLGEPPAPRPELAVYLEVPPAPPEIRKLLQEAAPPGANAFQRFLAVRQKLLDEVTAKGSGLPVPVPPSKVVDMLFGKKEGSPFEITAALGLLARWAGLPSRLGYGFDGGDIVAGESPEPGAAPAGLAALEQVREVRPKHGSTWLELYSDTHGWFQLLGLPRKARKSLGSKSVVNQLNLLPSEDVAAQIFVPLKVPPQGVFFRRVGIVAAVAVPAAAFLALLYTVWPLWVKFRRRARRRAWALRAGPAARIAVAYAEFRDLATDLGVGDPVATPLGFLDQVVGDQEHTELAWLVTRALWGDLADRLTDAEVFAAEELSRSLRRRLFEAQPLSIRTIALISRLSLRHPYAPELFSPRARALRRRKEVARAA